MNFVPAISPPGQSSSGLHAPDYVRPGDSQRSQPGCSAARADPVNSCCSRNSAGSVAQSAAAPGCRPGLQRDDRIRRNFRRPQSHGSARTVSHPALDLDLGSPASTCGHNQFGPAEPLTIRIPQSYDVFDSSADFDRLSSCWTVIERPPWPNHPS